MKKVISILLALVVTASISLSAGVREHHSAMSVITAPGNGAVTATSKWVPVAPGVTSGKATIKSIDFASANVIWASGYTTAADLAFRSTDGGANWSQFTLPSGNQGATNISARNDSVAIIGLYTGQIIRTQNGGAKWDTVYSYKIGTDPGFFDGVKYLTKDTAIAIGDADANGLVVVRSVDGGATWTRITNLPTPVNTGDSWFGYASYGSCIDSYGKTVWIATYAGTGKDPVIVKSTDGGTTWTAITVSGLTGGNSVNYYFRTIKFLDDKVGFAVDRQAGSSSTVAQKVHRTTDGGLTWSDTLSLEAGVAPANAKAYNVIPIRGTANVLAVGVSAATGAKSWWSSDTGKTWTLLATPGSSQLITGAFLNATTGFAGGVNQLLKYGNSVKVTFMANTATVPDTLKPSSSIQVRGGGAQLTWGDDTPGIMKNIGGDNWSYTGYFPVGETIPYKYVTKVNAASANVGWENDINQWGNGNRRLIVGQNDTTIALEFVNGSPNQQAQFWKPYTPSQDSIAVMFRVNMQNEENF
ncbi:MAG: WD40/YVTN/BNR-like repeat-containing protein, partial [Acidobacteriota bacterium]